MSREAVIAQASAAYELWAEEDAPDDFEAILERYGFGPQSIGWLGD